MENHAEIWWNNHSLHLKYSILRKFYPDFTGEVTNQMILRMWNDNGKEDININRNEAQLLLRETAMRSRIVFPESEQDEHWFKEGLTINKSGDFMKRLLKELNLGESVK